MARCAEMGAECGAMAREEILANRGATAGDSALFGGVGGAESEAECGWGRTGAANT